MKQPRRIAVTMGDPLGIGPEVIIKALSNAEVRHGCEFIVIGSFSVFSSFSEFKRLQRTRGIHFVAVEEAITKMSPLQAGRVSIACLNKAIEIIKTRGADALVTAPICKEHVILAGFPFPGHTEFLCSEFNVKKYAMMLFHSRLRVVLLTIHLPLREIFSHITTAAIIEKLELTAVALKTHFGIRSPRIAVCGLNPHAGEGGVLGDEEKTVIIPAMRIFSRRAAAKNVVVLGPVSSDTVFYAALKGSFDAVLCHYHDQGLIPLKSTGFETGVNMTLGLPFVRTSPDHGTAFDIAGKGIADPQSMIAAMRAAKEHPIRAPLRPPVPRRHVF